MVNKNQNFKQGLGDTTKTMTTNDNEYQNNIDQKQPRDIESCDAAFAAVDSSECNNRKNNGRMSWCCCCFHPQRPRSNNPTQTTTRNNKKTESDRPQQKEQKIQQQSKKYSDEDPVLSSAVISEYISPKETKPIVILRLAVVITWLCAAITVSYGVYWNAVENQFLRFKRDFHTDAQKVLESFHATIDKRLAAANTLATSLTMYAQYSNQTFPFVTMPNFVVPGSNARILLDALVINWLPLVTDETREEWEAYAYENRYQANLAFELDEDLRRREDARLGLLGDDRVLLETEVESGGRTRMQAWARETSAIDPQQNEEMEGRPEPLNSTAKDEEEQSPRSDFFLFDGSGYHPRIFNAQTKSIIPEGSGLYLPIWQSSPATVLKQAVLNADGGHLVGLKGILPYLAKNEKPRGALLHGAALPNPNVAAKTEDPFKFASQFRHHHEILANNPNTQLSYPVYDSFEEDAKFVGILATTLNWRLSLMGLLNKENAKGLICVIENRFEQVFSFRLDGPNVTYLGEGNPLRNNTSGFIFEDLMATHTSDEVAPRPAEQRRSYTTVPLDDEFNKYILKVYPTQDTYATYRTNEPVQTSLIAAAIFGMAAIVFLLYDFYVQKRHKTLMVKGIEQARRAATAERELNEYLAHEVRNPLAAAISACSFVSSAVNEAKPLTDEESRQSVRGDVNIISSSLKFINDLLRNMLDLHRAMSRQVQIEKKAADLFHDVLEPVASMLYCRDDNFEVSVDCPKNLTVEIDCLRLKQVVMNLGRNSAKFVEKGFVRLRAEVVTSCTNDEEGNPNQTVRIYVEDSGPGIPLEKREALFAKFQQSLDLLSQGTGVGLSLCKQLTDIMGGDLWLDECYDSGVEGHPGSCFVIDLNTAPLTGFDEEEYRPRTTSSWKNLLEGEENQEVEDMESGVILNKFTPESTNDTNNNDNITQGPFLTAPEGDNTFDPSPHRSNTVYQSSSTTLSSEFSDEPEQNQRSLPETLSVLLVDDDMVLRKLFSRSIKRAFPGWKVQEASSGETAIRLVDTEDFDLIFMDQYMASTEKQLLGTETTRELRSKGVKSKICGLSANDIEKAFLNAGADGFMLKPMPCKQDELEAALKVFYQIN